MALNDRQAWLFILLIGVASAAGVWNLRITTFWGDSATYYAMASSVAEDHDLRYEVRDILRVRRELGSGPEGLFLKKSAGGFTFDRSAGFPYLRRVRPEEGRLYFAKPFLHAIVAAPFVRLFRTRGLFVANAVAFAIAIGFAYAAARRQGRSPGGALTLVLALVFGGLTPLFLVWPAPELLYFALATIALALWRLDQPIAASVLIGALAYAKPPNIFLAIPLLAAPLFATGTLWARLRESTRRGLVIAATTLLFFGAYMAHTGDWNYQGGERKTFYGRFPLEQYGVTWENSGVWMSTNQVGPEVEGNAASSAIPSEPPRKAAELRVNFRYNLRYFWIGRFAGATLYFLPVVVALAMFLLMGPRDVPGFLAMTAFAATYLFYIWLIPDNWYGGSGTVGNRYFLTLVPLALFFVPRGRESIVALAALVSVAVFLRPIFLAPVYHSQHPGAHATRAAFRAFPAELSMLNDLSAFTEPWRKKQPIGSFGDAAANIPTDPRAYWLYFPDNGTFGQEPYRGVHGFWMRGRETAEVLVRMLDLKPIRRVRVRVTGGPQGEDLSIRAFGETQRVMVGPDRTSDAVFTQIPQGFPYKDTFVHVLRFRSSRSGIGSEGRPLGGFVAIRLEVDGDFPLPPAEH